MTSQRGAETIPQIAAQTGNTEIINYLAALIASDSQISQSISDFSPHRRDFITSNRLNYPGNRCTRLPILNLHLQLEH